MSYDLEKNNNSKKIIIGVSILFCTIILIIGGTLAFFTQGNNNELGNIVTTDIDGTLLYNDKYEENSLYNRQGLIPASLDVVLKTYKRTDAENKCLDMNDYSSCSVYRFSIKNNSNVSQELIMNLNPTANSYNNLKFLLFELKNDIPNQIKESTLLQKGKYDPIQLANNFTLTPNEERMYELVFYVENQPYAQDDAGKQFGAGISINSITTGAYVVKQYGTTCWNDEAVLDENNQVIGHRLISFNGINNNFTKDDNEKIIYDENYGKINESCTGYVDDIDKDGYYEVKIPSKFKNYDITHLGNQLLIGIDLNSFTPNNYTKIESIEIGEGIKVLEDGSSEGGVVFGGFTGVGVDGKTQEIVVPNLTIKLPETLEYIGDSYIWTTAVSYLEIPYNVNTIGSYSIGNNQKLTAIKFIVDEDNKSNLTTINNYAFYNNSLNYPVDSPLIIPSSVTFIGTSAFNDNPNLMQIKYSGDAQGFGSYWSGNAEVIK